MARASVSIVRGRPLGRLRRAGQGLRQRAALDQLQDQERRAGVLADAVDLDDVGVVQPRHGLGLDAGTSPVTSGSARAPAWSIFTATWRCSSVCQAR